MNEALIVFDILVCIWLIATPTIKTGAFETSGLVCVACSAFAEWDAGACNDRIDHVRTIGISLALWGLLWRFVLRSGWQELTKYWVFAHVTARFFGIDHRRTPRRK